MTVTGDQLPMVDGDLVPEPAHCTTVDGCITCGDVAVPLTVVTVEGGDARCIDDDGNEETVAIELVDEVRAGDRLLVHARVAIEHLGGRT